MSANLYADNQTLRTRLKSRLAERSTGLIVALALEAIILLLLFSLGMSGEVQEPAGVALTTFDASADDNSSQAEEQKESEQEPDESKPQDTPAPEQPVAPPKPIIPTTNVQPSPPLPDLIPLPKDVMEQADISRKPAPKQGATKQAYGPVDTGTPGDSPRVGTAPNGEPLYAARWYREPTHQELAGYLSTASGPGWGLIACKTAPDFRVEDCVGLEEYPSGSNITRAVLAAAWQFRVRPPRIGGRSLVGEWVRIRIDYTVLQR